MSDTQSKIDAAAQKAFSDAAERKTAEAVSAKAVEKAVAADPVSPVKPAAIAAAVAKPSQPAKSNGAAVKKSSPKKAAVKKAKKPTAAKAARATATKAAPARVAARKPATKTTSKPSISQLKDKIMATANTSTTDYAATAKGAVSELQTRAKAAYDKGSEMSGDVASFHKSNLEAMVESGKILVAGMQDMGRGYIEDAKTAAETVQDDVKKMAAIKSPTEFFQLQGEIVRRNFDAAVAQTSKNAEAMMKLANQAFAPISNRASVATEKFSAEKFSKAA